MLKLQLWFVSHTRTPTPPEEIKFESSIAMVKDLLVDNIDEHVNYFIGEATRIAKPMKKINIDLLLVCMLSLLK